MRNLIDYLFYFDPDVELAIKGGLESYNSDHEREANVVWLCLEDWKRMRGNGRVPGVRLGLNACCKASGNVMVGRVE